MPELLDAGARTLDPAQIRGAGGQAIGGVEGQQDVGGGEGRLAFAGDRARPGRRLGMRLSGRDREPIAVGIDRQDDRHDSRKVGEALEVMGRRERRKSQTDADRFIALHDDGSPAVVARVSPVHPPASIDSRRRTPRSGLDPIDLRHGCWKNRQACTLPGRDRDRANPGGLVSDHNGSACPMQWCGMGMERNGSGLRGIVARFESREPTGGRKSWARRVLGVVRSCVSWSAHRCRRVMPCVRAVSRTSRRRFLRTVFEQADTRTDRVDPGRSEARRGDGPRAVLPRPLEPLERLQPLSSSFAIARIWISSVPA